MTKFEEILRKIKPRKKFLEFNAGITYWYCLSDLIQKFGNWHSDEEFQELKEEYSNQADSILLMLEEVEAIKSKLQQQALPVVPECVGIWIKKCQELNWMITDVLAPESWSSDFAKDTEKWLKDSKENFNLLALAFITGKYQVEKPQLFYLREKNTGYYLRKKGNNEYGITPHYSNDYDEKYMHYKFTQYEIDSMETGSYEQIEVEK